MDENFLHFNSKTTLEASKAFEEQIERGNYMFISIAGAMSTAEIGICLSKMIRKGKIHAIACTGANLEEDIFNLIGKKHYKKIKNWRCLNEKDEQFLLNNNLNRITDVCIPEKVISKFKKIMFKYWKYADQKNIKMSPYQYIYKIIKSGDLDFCDNYLDSWVVAAAKKNIPIFTPGWEDSTLGNIFIAGVISKHIKNLHIVKNGLEQMQDLISWYRKTTVSRKIGFFQIGGGISGDFAICVVPLILQDLNGEVPLWSYFCQISDSTTSYGSYSGANPSEKITWAKITVNTPSFSIESDASIIVPLMFYYILSR